MPAQWIRLIGVRSAVPKSISVPGARTATGHPRFQTSVDQLKVRTCVGLSASLPK